MPEKEESENEVTFKVPSKLLLYVALALGGGGALWNRLDSGFLEERTERAGRATYETLAKTVNRLSRRVTACEERLDALEQDAEVSGNATGGGDSRRNGGRHPVGSAPVPLSPPKPVDGDGIPEEALAPAELPSYDAVQKLAEVPNG